MVRGVPSRGGGREGREGGKGLGKGKEGGREGRRGGRREEGRREVLFCRQMFHLGGDIFLLRSATDTRGQRTKTEEEVKRRGSRHTV